MIKVLYCIAVSIVSFSDTNMITSCIVSGDVETDCTKFHSMIENASIWTDREGGWPYNVEIELFLRSSPSGGFPVQNSQCQGAYVEQFQRKHRIQTDHRRIEIVTILNGGAKNGMP